MTRSYMNEIPAVIQKANPPVLGPSRVICLTIAAAAIGLAIRLENGEYSSQAIALVTAGWIAAAMAVVGVQLTLRRKPMVLTVLAILALQIVTQFLFLPGVDLHRGTNLWPFYLGMLAVVALLLAGIFSRRGERVWFPLLLTTSLLLNFWMVRSSLAPYIDSWTMQQDAAERLLSGHNPYDMTFPDIYQSTHRGNQKVYGDGLVVHNQVIFGFPYPPLSLILSTLGYALAGDHRYAQAMAVTLAGLFIGYSRPGMLAKFGAVLLLFTPTVFLVIGRSWTEPFSVMLLAAVVFAACRRSKWLAVALGLALASKQYMVLAVPLSFLLLPANWRWNDWLRLLIGSALVAMLVTLPFAVWNWHQFWTSTVTVQRLAPFRWDALSYLVCYGKHWRFSTTSPILLVWSLIGTLAMLAVSLRKASRSPSGFAAALGLISLVFFALNKQAFCNYYFFTVGAFCCAIAASQPLPVVGMEKNAGLLDWVVD